MCGNFPNIKVVRDNGFSLVIPLKRRTFVSCKPIDEDIDATQLTDVVVKLGGVVYTPSLGTDGVTIVIQEGLPLGTYDLVLTAKYQGTDIRAAYESAVTSVEWNSMSDAQQFVPGSPIVCDAAYIIGGALTDAELEALKAEYRERNAELAQATADMEAAKEHYDQLAEQLTGVAQEQTLTDGVTAIREDISHIDIDTTTLAKQGTNPNATLSEVQTQATSAANDAAAAKTAAQNAETTAQGTANKNEILAAIAANAGIPTLTIPDSTAAQELAPNTLYVFAERSTDLTLSLGTPIVGVANEYHLFLIIGSTAPTITWPTGISWNGGSAPTIAASKTYEVSILNNVAAYFEV